MSPPHAEIPLLDWTLAEHDRPAFIAQLRGMLINGGFSTAQFFALPADVKDAADMNDMAHFNGYLRRGTVENPTREQFNYGDDNADPIK
ncbi:hypothetical protein DFH07DRAFT_950647 [Mycena maculata]|uniref:Uncharacterized protein n=1 Tax=Mycena maculata TaxID=230809 RepID=A0AAD7K598_9AGAR|nr:hypothetical protein DFH07DRAFT_950647 [Mycena maculata]